MSLQARQPDMDPPRFRFGRNWSHFLRLVDERRIDAATASLQDLLGRESLEGARFLDVGCGSGLSSLAASRLGAQVHSFDFDAESVECTREMKRRFAPDAEAWRIERGSVLDRDYLRGLGSFDVVYSWGVLHHTGALHEAMERVLLPLAAGGSLYIALYNDQGPASDRWRAVKRRYNDGGTVSRAALVTGVFAYFGSRGIVRRLLYGPTRLAVARRARGTGRGMSRRYDLIDWVGGYPFEVARPDDVVDFYRGRGFGLVRLRTCGGQLGCNEYVFEASGRAPASEAPEGRV